MDEKTMPRCSFCGKSQNQVQKLIAGPGAYICNECIELCNEIIAEDVPDILVEEPAVIPKPTEIKQVLFSM